MKIPQFFRRKCHKYITNGLDFALPSNLLTIFCYKYWYIVSLLYVCNHLVHSLRIDIYPWNFSLHQNEKQVISPDIDATSWRTEPFRITYRFSYRGFFLRRCPESKTFNLRWPLSWFTERMKAIFCIVTGIVINANKISSILQLLLIFSWKVRQVKSQNFLHYCRIVSKYNWVQEPSFEL